MKRELKQNLESVLKIGGGDGHGWVYRIQTSGQVIVSTLLVNERIR